MGELSQVQRFAAKHAGKGYDYSETVYVNAKTKVGVRCLVHGIFWQLPSNHLRGNGCPSCAKELAKQGTFKQLCKDKGIDYWRALKRREAGMSEEKILAEGYVRKLKETASALVVHGVSYPNILAACAALEPVASPTTIERWVKRGMSPEEAFARIPNPGYRNGIIYCVTHRASGKQYVGLTVQTLERRWGYHCEQAAAGYVKGELSLHAAIREFGAEAFDLHCLDSGTSKVDLEAKERKWIADLGTLAPGGFNLDPGGVSGGSSARPTKYGGMTFRSKHEASQYLAAAKGISYDAAAKRLLTGRTEVKTPAKPGLSLVKSKVYKAWSNIIHGAVNPNSKDFIPGLEIYPAWRDFDVFHADVGDGLPGLCFARIDKSKSFTPDNCAWMTKTDASKINAAHMKAAGTLTGNTKAIRARKAEKPQEGT